MSDATPSTPSSMPRLSLAGVCAAHAAIYAWAATVLPWRAATVFTGLTAVVALLHLAVAILALLRSRHLPKIWRRLSWVSLVYVAWIGWDLLSSSWYIVEIYGRFGKGIASGLAAIFGLFVLLTVPVAAWGLAATRTSGRGSAPRKSAVLALLVAVGASFHGEARARSTPLPSFGEPVEVSGELKRVLLPTWRELPDARKPTSLFLDRPVACDQPLAPPSVSAVVVFAGRDGGGRRAACVQAPPDRIVAEIQAVLESQALRAPVKIDIIRTVHELTQSPAFFGVLVDLLVLRPGLDGACFGESCMMPWQLMASGAFAVKAPVPYMAKIRLGYSAPWLRSRLGAGKGGGIDGLRRITTDSFVIDPRGDLHRFVRMREVDVDVTKQRVFEAERAAEAFTLAAQDEDGNFRYSLDPYRGAAQHDNPSIPRHAGAALALCELGLETPEVEQAIEASLDVMARYERPIGEASAALRSGRKFADLGSTALSLIAVATCRERAGPEYDELIGRMSRFVMALQRPDGRFRPGFELNGETPVEGPTPLFAGGQAVYGLALVEGLAADEANADRRALWPSHEELHEAVERGMDYVAEEHWSHPLADFFYLKENWHCLAIKGSFPHHRHEGYERFCIDYMEFKSRLVLDERDDVDPDIIGGFGFGNLMPPHNGSSAGVGEALSIAIELKREYGLDTSEDEARMKKILEFVIRQQWSPTNCFACSTKYPARGGFSGYLPSTEGRIDHVWHAWSAIGHGARVLGLGPPGSEHPS